MENVPLLSHPPNPLREASSMLWLYHSTQSFKSYKLSTGTEDELYIGGGVHWGHRTLHHSPLRGEDALPHHFANIYI